MGTADIDIVHGCVGGDGVLELGVVSVYSEARNRTLTLGPIVFNLQLVLASIPRL